MSTSPPIPPNTLFAQAEAECKRLDSLGWKMVLELNIRSTVGLASTLALAIRAPELNSGPVAALDRAILDFIIAHLSASPFLQQVVRERAAQSIPAGGPHVRPS